MTNFTALATTNQNDVQGNCFDAFSDIGPVDQFDLKKDHLGAQMGALMAFSGKNRSELMEILGWKKSRVSNVLSGKCNLTIKTVWEFASSLGFDFDVVFHASGDSPQIQPWQIAHQVARDLQEGSYKNFYLSLKAPDSGGIFSIELASQMQMNPGLSSTAIQIAIN